MTLKRTKLLEQSNNMVGNVTKMKLLQWFYCDDTGVFHLYACVQLHYKHQIIVGSLVVSFGGRSVLDSVNFDDGNVIVR